MQDNIREFPGKGELPENPMQLAPSNPGFCSHEAVIVDIHSRSLNCANVKCGASLDAFNFLASNAQTIQSAWSRYRQVMTEATEVAERVTMLKKEEQRLRAMVKRLQEKSGAVVSVRNREL